MKNKNYFTIYQSEKKTKEIKKATNERLNRKRWD